MTRMRHVLIAAASLLVLGLTAGGVALPASASSGWGTSTYGKPTWCQKFETVSALPYIAVDDNPSSPHRDTIYVAWDRFGGSSSSSNAVLVSHSTDGGKIFSAPVFASSTAAGPKGDIGADPFVSPDGTLHVAWHDVQNNSIVEANSADGGQSFGPTHTISPTQVAFDVAIPAQASRHALVYPACGADASTGRTAATCTAPGWTKQRPTAQTFSCPGRLTAGTSGAPRFG